MPLFGKSSKNPGEAVKQLKESLLVLEKQHNGESQKKFEKAHDDVSKYIFTISSLLFSSESDQQSDIILAQMSQEMYNSAVISLLIKNLQNVEFEARKESVEIFSHVLRRQIGTRTPTVEYICTTDEILVSLCRGFENLTINHNTSAMLRECLRYESLAKIVLFSEVFQDFFKYVECPHFDVAADAFTTFKDLVTRHKTIAANYLETHYDSFFFSYNQLLISENFVTQLNSLKLLAELLTDRNNSSVMKKYINDSENLKITMTLLLHQAPVIKYEAFSLFKIFILNPKKPEDINLILLKNKELLRKLFVNFLPELDDLNLFQAEKSSIVKEINAL